MLLSADELRLIGNAFTSASEYMASEQAAAIKLDNAQKLQLYGLFKRATAGTSADATKKPGMLDFTGRAKFDAWRQNDQKTKEAAMVEYVALVQAITQGTAGDEDVRQDGGGDGGDSLGVPSVSVPTSDAAADALGTDLDALPELHDSARAGFVPQVKYLVVDQKTPVDSLDKEGRTALHWAADRGHEHVANALIELGADVNAKDMGGQTPLHYAALCEHEQLARILAAAGGDANVQDEDGDTPKETAPRSWDFL